MNAEELLRRAFDAHTDRVQPSADALASIRHRIAQRSRLARRITMGLASLSSAAVVTVTAVLVGTASCAPVPTPTPPPPGATTTGPSPTTPTTQPNVGAPDQVPIYYLGTARDRVVLYREFRTVTPADASLAARVAAAVREMLHNDPMDPQYTGAWPGGASVREVRVDGGAVTVDLGGVATNSVGAETAAMTVQQLVWTVTAVAADAGSPVDGVRLLIDGAAASELWGHVAVDDVLGRADSLETQAPVWLISPQQDEAVGRTFAVHLDGAVFEATVALRVRDATGTIVDEQSVTLDAGAPQRGEATVELTLAPGRYTLEALYYSPADGSEQALDDHEITVS
jgi:spore germination protein GerM